MKKETPEPIVIMKQCTECYFFSGPNSESCENCGSEQIESVFDDEDDEDPASW